MLRVRNSYLLKRHANITVTIMINTPTHAPVIMTILNVSWSLVSPPCPDSVLDVWAVVDIVFDGVELVLFNDVEEDVELELGGLELVFCEVETVDDVLEAEEDVELDNEVELVDDTVVDLLVVVQEDAGNENISDHINIEWFMWKNICW